MTAAAPVDIPCPHRLDLPVLGVETTFATNAARVLGVVREAWGGWADLRRVPDVVTPSGTVVRIVVAPVEGGAGRTFGPAGSGGEFAHPNEGTGRHLARDIEHPDEGEGGPLEQDMAPPGGAADTRGRGRSSPPDGAPDLRDRSGPGRDSPSAPPPGAAVPRPNGWPRARVPDAGVLRVDGPGGYGWADTGRLESVLVVDPELLARPARLVEGWLEPLTLFLVGALDRQPLHAAAVVALPPHFPRTQHEAGSRTASGTSTGAAPHVPRTQHEAGPPTAPGRSAGATPHFSRTEREAGIPGSTTALLLAGPSGVGKSTLTYAAWRSGRFRVLADEPTYIQLEPRLRVWGRRARLHLPAGARAHFPELREVAATRLPTGKTKIVVDLAGAGALPCADRAGLLLLSRHSGEHPFLEPVTPEEAVAALTSDLDPGYDLFTDTIGERIGRVARGGAWRLSLTGDPEAALPLLEEAAARVGGGPHP